MGGGGGGGNRNIIQNHAEGWVSKIAKNASI